MALTITRPSNEDVYAIRNGTPDGLGRWDRDTIDAAVIAGLDRIGDNTAGGGGGGSTPVTANSQIATSGTVTIPSGAKGYTVSVLTGTITFNGAGPLPVGFSESDPNTLAAGISVVIGASSSAYIRWNT